MSRDSALVSADWAEKNLETPGVVFVEVDEDTTAYDGGHIPGAIKIDWKKDLQDPVRRDFVNQEQFAALLSERVNLKCRSLLRAESGGKAYPSQRDDRANAQASHSARS